MLNGRLLFGLHAHVGKMSFHQALSTMAFPSSCSLVVVCAWTLKIAGWIGALGKVSGPEDGALCE